MPVTASGIFALPLAYLKATVAASAAFQALVGAVDANSALPHVFEAEADDGQEGQDDASGFPPQTPDSKPRAIVDIEGNHQFQRIGTTQWLGGGDLSLVFEIPTPAGLRGEMQFRQARIDFLNKVGAVIAEMQLLAGTAGYLNITQFSEKNSGRADPTQNNGEEFFVSYWTVTWLG